MIVAKHLVTKAFIIVAVFLITACGSTQTSPPAKQTQQNTPSSEPTKQVVLLTPENGLTPRQRLSKALRSLEQGQSNVAEVELIQYLKEVPGNNRASALLSQIRTPSDEFYPSDYFTLELRSGQSLSTLAKKYLGSALEFYALAKYNQIEKPSRVNIGSQIKIPLTMSAKKVLEEEKAQVAAQAEPETNLEVPQIPDEEPMSEIEEIVEDDPVLSAEQLINLIGEANQTNDYSRSSKLLEDLLQTQAMDKEITNLAIQTYEGHANALLESNPVQASEVFVKLGNLQKDSQQDIAAFEAFKSANLADENNTEALSQVNSLRDSITQQYHREASVAFRQQELDKAIAKWDIVLSVDPDHSNALAYRSQAMELKERLKALEN